MQRSGSDAERKEEQHKMHREGENSVKVNSFKYCSPGLLRLVHLQQFSRSVYSSLL